MATCNNNPSVEKYYNLYTKAEKLDELSLKPQEPKDLLQQILDYCAEKKHEPLLERNFVNVCPGQENGTKKGIRVMQWNILAQALSTGKDNFVRCPPSALEWDLRRIRILEEILRIHPDVICLQEVDHFGFLSPALESVGFKGHFFPKVDSPALYTENTNGPDGCAMFYKTSVLELVNVDNIVLNANGRPCNQVSIAFTLKQKNQPAEFVVATTHLKAKLGWHELRQAQGHWFLDYLAKTYSGKPLIITGDFNGENDEPVYKLFKESKINLCSTYTILSGDKQTEPPFTSFKMRGRSNGEEVESCRTIDYMWYSQNAIVPKAVLSIPKKEEEIGSDGLPSFRYPSDHFALAADYEFK